MGTVMKVLRQCMVKICSACRESSRQLILKNASIFGFHYHDVGVDMEFHMTTGEYKENTEETQLGYSWNGDESLGLNSAGNTLPRSVRLTSL